MSLRHALLGMLADNPASGYELSKNFQESIGRYAWHAGHSQIYPELAKLADTGLITLAEEGARGRNTYAITEAGRVELRTWLRSPPSQGRVRNEQMLRLFLVPALGPEDAKAHLRHLIERTERDLAELRPVAERLATLSPPGSPPHFSLLPAEFGLRQFGSLIDWANWALARLEEANEGAEPTEMP